MILARTLSGRLLLLTVMIVMVIEVLVFLPSVARFREDYLLQRLQMAQIASLALMAADDAMVEETLERELLDRAEVSSIAIRRDFIRQLVLQAPEGAQVEETFDLRDASFGALIADALSTIIRSEPRVIRVIGEPDGPGGVAIEITMDEAPLCKAVLDFGGRVLLISLIISGVSGLLIFFSCRRLIVRPMERVVENMTGFQKNPEGAPLAEASGTRLREIARAESALAEMQGDIRTALKQKSRLAELGTAVAKISHDLRNMLASAQLMADRLEGSSDPVVARIGPKLIGSIDRAARLCVSTLKHGRADEAPPEPRRVALVSIVEDVREAVFPDGGRVRLDNALGENDIVMCDPEHLFRIFSNLTRNASQAIEATGKPGVVRVSAKADQSDVLIEIRDDGPGMPAKALENLFQPFLGGARRGGAGLGLSIAGELASSNGGSLTLLESTPSGTAFTLRLPG